MTSHVLSKTWGGCRCRSFYSKSENPKFKESYSLTVQLWLLSSQIGYSSFVAASAAVVVVAVPVAVIVVAVFVVVLV